LLPSSLPWCSLFNFFMNGVATQDGVVFFQLHAVGRIFTIFGGHVSRCSGHPRGFMLGTFKNDLVAVAFLSHFRSISGGQRYTFFTVSEAR